MKTRIANRSVNETSTIAAATKRSSGAVLLRKKEKKIDAGGVYGGRGWAR